MPSIAREHADWLRLVESSGPFVSIPTLAQVFPQGLNTVDPALRDELRRAHEEWEDSQEGNHPDAALHTAWIRFVLERLLGLPTDLLRSGPALPPHVRVEQPEHGETLTPEFALVNPPDRQDKQPVRLLIQRYPAGQDLERAVPGLRWNASPATRMMTLLRGSDVALGLVTNGEQWLLVNALPDLTSGFATWEASLWLDEPMTLRAFCSLLDATRFFGVPENETLVALIQQSADHQQEVTNQLGYQVRNAVEVLIQAIDGIDKDRGRTLLAEQQPEDLYNAALTVMMRLVFLFCAEERGLLLLGDEVYDANYAVSPLSAQLRVSADQHGEEVLATKADAWARLLATFRAVHGGLRHEALQLPAYGGHLFDPDRYPFLEGRAAGTSWHETPAAPLPIDNRTTLHLLEALQLLQTPIPGGGSEAQRLSFRALDIEQIGHVYEGLLDHTARRAESPVLGLDGKRDAITETPLAELEAAAAKGEAALLAALRERTGRSESRLKKLLAERPDSQAQQRLLIACDNDTALYARVLPYAGLLRQGFAGYPVVYTPGSVYVTAGADRRSTGTHYTPRALTESIVQHTLDPLCYAGPAEGLPRSEWRLRPARDLLRLKICDIAMGSGAFLVQAARYLSEALLEAWASAEAEYRAQGVALPVQITPEGALSQHPETDTILEETPEGRRAQALRLVCDRCLYGVDKNAMAVEMAKLSLWLITLDKGRPFTFLDHALRCGDSLLGIADIHQLQFWTLDLERHGPQAIPWSSPLIRHALDDALRMRREIAAHPARSVDDLRKKDDLLYWAERALDLLRLGADLLVGSALAASPREREAARQATLSAYALSMSIAEHHRAERDRGAPIHPDERAKAEEALAALRTTAAALLAGRRPFHWPLEFPEVFTEEPQSLQAPLDLLRPFMAESATTRPGPGFSAIVSNPPFMGGQKITGELGTAYREYLVDFLGRGQRGSADLCAYFFLRAGQLLASGGGTGMLATNTIAQGDTREVGLDQLVAGGFSIPRAIPSKPWPGDASLEVAHVWLRRGPWQGAYELDTRPVDNITPYLTAPGAVDGKPYPLVANANKSFQGSIVLGMGFVLEPEEAQALIARDPRNREVLFPYLNGEDLNSRPDQSPSRWVINFHDWPLERAETYPDAMAIVREKVKPERQRRNDDGSFVLRKPLPERWWIYAEKRPALYATIAGMERVLVISLVTHYVSFGFVPANQVFAHRLAIFPFDQRSQFALLQSNFH